MIKKVFLALFVATVVFAQKPKLPEVIKVTGMGVPPENASPAQAKALACRAAQVDAYRQLAEIVKGVQVDSQTTVQDFVVQSDEIRTRVHALIQGAQILARKQNPDGSCEVELSLSVGEVEKAMPPKVEAPPPPLPKPKETPKKSETSFFGTHIKRGYWSQEVIEINEKGLKALKNKNYEKAEALFRQSVSLDPQFDIGFNNLALVLKFQGRLSEALQAYRQAISIDPKWSDHHVNLGWLLWQMGDKAQAKAEAEKALSLYDKNEWAHHLMAYIALQNHDPEKAVFHCKKAIENTPEADPFLPKYFYRLGKAYEMLEEKEAARQAYRQALNYRSDYWEAKEALKKL